MASSAASRPRKSPLRARTAPRAGRDVSPSNKHHRPFQEHTITNYTDAAKTLDRWMTTAKIDEDLTTYDTDMLNRFFADLPMSSWQVAGTSRPIVSGHGDCRRRGAR
jgi:hypothetical protein